MSCAALPCRAQDAPGSGPAPAAQPSAKAEPSAKLLKQYRFYAGAQAAVQAFRVQSTSYATQEAIVRPLYVFAGYQMTPHVAIQAGFMRRSTGSSKITSTSYNQANQVVLYSQELQRYNVAVPVLLRVRLARQPANRFYVDALLGPTLLFHRYQIDETLTVGGQVQSDVHEDFTSRHLYLSGGFSAGCRLRPHLDLMVEATANRDTEKPASDGVKPFTFGVGAGLRYSFNFSKAAD
ncbi:outer membrane beta-barrel protein [Hymenobacter humi]|uniref:Outer membrane beta-barrel protein n=1 Tax=Hymenobacter humi TaxID=1411620 RepID=A0ABW2U7N7_9BACT